MRENPEVVGAKLSPDGQFFALCIANREVKLVLAKSGEAVLRRRSKVSTVPMLAVHWVKGSLSLLIVTNSGVELHQLQENVKSRAFKLKHSKTVSYPILHHWFLPKEQALLLVDPQSNFACYRVGQGKALQRLCKFSLQCAGTSVSPPPKGYSYCKKQISLLALYGELCCIFVHEKEGRLQVFRLRSEGMELQHIYDLHSPGRYEVSVLDNVLVVHNVQAEVSLMFDIKVPEAEPISSPLPLGLSAAARRLLFHTSTNLSTPSRDAEPVALPPTTASGAEEGLPPSQTESNTATATAVEEGLCHGKGDQGSRERTDAEQQSWQEGQQQQAVHYGRVTFVSPRFVLDYDRKAARGILWTLHLDLAELARTWPSAQRPRLFQFLQQRRDMRAKELMLSLMLKYMEVPSNLSLLSGLLAQCNRTLLEQSLHEAQQGGRLYSAEEEDSLQRAHNTPVGASSFNLARTHSSSSFNLAPTHSSSSVRPPASSSSSSLHVSPVEPDSSPPDSPRSSALSSSSSSSSSMEPDPLPSVDTGSPKRDHNLDTFDPSASAASLAPSASVLAAASSGGPGWLDGSQYPWTPVQLLLTSNGLLYLTQREVLSHLFLPAARSLSPSLVLPVLTEYLRSLNRFRLPPEPSLQSLLVDLLLSQARFHEIHQHLQYHVLADSLPLAHRLLALDQVYPPALQLALDMFYRLQAFPTLLRTFLSQHKPVAGLKLVSHKSGLFSEPGLGPRDFLLEALYSKDDVAFFSVFKFFQKRNLHRRGTIDFAKEENCDEFVREFAKRFAPGGGSSARKESWSWWHDLTDDLQAEEEQESQAQEAARHQDRGRRNHESAAETETRTN
eukprot:gb/GEZN01001632.1/.p1 GENE.gb/GEZN01001632.1/~~gb/GEZN01001632.1/.p1  ORF type:complete len:949 (-),score=203.22 gb/GEZN01001632.1/:66-2588(-)